MRGMIPRHLRNGVLLLFTILFFNQNSHSQNESCTYIENGGILTVEMESADLSGTFWVKGAEVPDYTGEGYLEYTGGDATGVPGRSVLRYSFRITEPGRYSFKARAYRSAYHDNDVWTRFPEGGVMTKVNGDSSGAKGSEWFKFMIGARGSWNYFMKTQHKETGENLHDVYVDFPEAGVYTVEFSGRASGFKLDRFVLYKTSGYFGMNPENPESARENCVLTSAGPYVLNEIADQQLLPGNPYEFKIPDNTFGHPDGKGMGYAVYLKGYNPLPEWLNFDLQSNTFSGTASVDDTGSYQILVKAQDGDGRYVITDFVLKVNPNQGPVVVQQIPVIQARIGEALYYTIPDSVFYDANGDVLSHSLSLQNGQALPVWLDFDPANLSISGTPAKSDEGLVHLALRAYDPYGEMAEAKFTLMVGGNRSPVVKIPVSDQSCYKGSLFTFTLPAGTFHDEDQDPLKISAIQQDGNMLPAWLSFDPVTMTFSGTPGNGVAGQYAITVIADDGKSGKCSVTFLLKVEGALAVTGSKIRQTAVYPNPAASFLTIETGETGHYSVMILDRNGGLKGEWKGQGDGSVSLNISELALKPGLYFIRYRNEGTGEMGVASFIKE